MALAVTLSFTDRFLWRRCRLDLFLSQEKSFIPLLQLVDPVKQLAVGSFGLLVSLSPEGGTVEMFVVCSAGAFPWARLDMFPES
jgi:hypothetical protein